MVSRNMEHDVLRRGRFEFELSVHLYLPPADLLAARTTMMPTDGGPPLHAVLSTSFDLVCLE